MKIRLTSPTFDASAQTVTHPSFSDVTLSGIQLIVNVTDQVIIYNFADTAKGGTLAGDVLTLEFNTTTMSDTDELMVLVEDGVAYQLPTGAATAANQTTLIAAVDTLETLLGTIDADTGAILVAVDTIETLIASTNTKLDTVIGHVDGIETLVGTTNTTLTTIDGRVDGLETSNSAIQTAVELLDDTVATLGTTTYTEATNKGVVIGAVRRDANTTLVGTTNEVAPLQVNATGELKVAQIAALPTGSNVIGGITMAANATTSPAKARDVAAGANDTGIPAQFVRRDTPTAVTPIAGDYEFAQISANGEQWVRSIGEVADDAAVTLGTQRGMMNAGVSVQTDGTDPTAVSAEGDAAIFRTDMNRILLVNQTHPRGLTVSADYASAQTNVSVIAATASLSIYITDIMLSNGATAGNVTLLDGSGGTVKWEAYPAINGGAVLNLRQPIKLTANTALCLTSTTVTTHSIFIGYYLAP